MLGRSPEHDFIFPRSKRSGSLYVVVRRKVSTHLTPEVQRIHIEGLPGLYYIYNIYLESTAPQIGVTPFVKDILLKSKEIQRQEPLMSLLLPLVQPTALLHRPALPAHSVTFTARAAAKPTSRRWRCALDRSDHRNI